MKHKLMGLLLVTAVIILTTGCINQLNVGPVQTDEENVEAGDINTARVNIQMGVGKLDINGGAAGLLDAEFTYNVEEWKPEVDYKISGNEGRPAPFILKLGHDRSPQLGPPAGDDDGGALATKQPGRGLADAGGSSSDQGHPPGQAARFWVFRIHFLKAPGLF